MYNSREDERQAGQNKTEEGVTECQFPVTEKVGLLVGEEHTQEQKTDREDDRLPIQRPVRDGIFDVNQENDRQAENAESVDTNPCNSS